VQTCSSFLNGPAIKKAKASSIDRLPDDFIMAGTQCTHTFQDLVSTFEQVCMELGIPIAHKTSVNPTTVMVFIGLEIDTSKLMVRIPIQNIQELSQLISLISTINKRKKYRYGNNKDKWENSIFSNKQLDPTKHFFNGIMHQIQLKHTRQG
jgi:hypothetical protein